MVTDYSVAQKVVHWLMALIIMLDLFVAQKFGGEMTEFDRLDSRGDHATSGTIILILLILRIYLRFKNGAPALPTGMPNWQIWLAKAGHIGLYLLIGFLVLSGLFTAMNASAPIEIFGQLDIAIAGQTDEKDFSFIRRFHEFATKAIIAIIVIHIFAALYHHFIAKDDSLVKMLKFWRRLN